MMRLCVLVAALVPLVACVQQFHGHKVLRVRKPSMEHVHALRHLEENNHELDFWKSPDENRRDVHLRVTPDQMNDVLSYFDTHKIAHDVMVENVQANVEAQNVPNLQGCIIGESTGGLVNYERTIPSYQLMRDLNARYPNITRVVDIGRSYMGTEIIGLEIDVTPNTAKPGYFIDGGIHAREWISPATVKNVAIALLENYEVGEFTATKMLTEFVWTIVPVVNPDGYEYTWDVDRFWRKTRSPNAGSTCVGTDPNRNADISWTGRGSSTNPCSETYRGSAPFSEPEVKAIYDYVLRLGNVRAYWNVHSYGQDLFLPWGYTNEDAPDRTDHQNAGNAYADAVRSTTGASYSPRPDLSTVSGDLSDCIYANTTSTYSGVIELRDNGRYGFNLPATEICPTSQETYYGLAAHANYVINNI